jgi:hypothetical protein
MPKRKATAPKTLLQTPLDYFRAVLDSPGLTPSERLVLLAMLRHNTANLKGQSHPGVRLLCAETGLSDHTVRSAARRLVEKGWLVLLFSGRGGAHDRADAYGLSVPTGSGYRLGDIPSGNPNIPNGNPEIPNGNPNIPNGNGYRTTAFELAPGELAPPTKPKPTALGGDGGADDLQDQDLPPDPPAGGDRCQEHKTTPSDGCAACDREVAQDITDATNGVAQELESRPFGLNPAALGKFVAEHGAGTVFRAIEQAARKDTVTLPVWVWQQVEDTFTAASIENKPGVFMHRLKKALQDYNPPGHPR